ncbi:MAG: hypothetical protein CVV53_04675 [Spirochaetae bacterium HGW-Spirochaetae-9]|nr:MAG: hypothetical protein CVV53_04675 [Spirochaetae bacterium HGW-Spirochaetae-9]
MLYRRGQGCLHRLRHHGQAGYSLYGAPSNESRAKGAESRTSCQDSRGRRWGERVNGYIAAPSTLPGQKFGFVFLGCRLEGDMASGSTYLGRPWRGTAKAAFVDCELGSHIAPEGWDNWGKPENEASVEFVECGSHGPGAPAQGIPFRKRLPWVRSLNEEEAFRFKPAALLSGSDGWTPWESSG